jgi:hypothetical protein
MSSPATTLDPRQTALINEIQNALDKYDGQRSTLLEKAFEAGGADAVSKLEDEHQALRDSLFELMKRQLIANSAKFPSLMDDTINATKAITSSINSLSKFADILGSITQVVNLVGRAVLLFGA